MTAYRQWYKLSTVDIMNTRNEVITKLNEQGLSYGQIAKAFGITRQRVCQIVNKRKKNLTTAGK